MFWNVFSCLLSHIPYYCVITQYSLTKINSGDISGYSSIAFNIVPKPWPRYYTVITPHSTVLYCNVLYCTPLLRGPPFSPCGKFGSSGTLYCTLLYTTVLYCTVLYCTLLLRGAPVRPCGKFGSSGTLYCTLQDSTSVNPPEQFEV